MMLKYILFVFCALCFWNGVHAQVGAIEKETSVRKTIVDFGAILENYTGISYSAADLQNLRNSVATLDSLNHVSKPVASYSLLKEIDVVNNLSISLSSIEGKAVGCVFSFSSTGELSRIAECKIQNSDLSVDQINIFSEIMVSEGNSYFRASLFNPLEIPNTISRAFEQYISYISGDSEYYPVEDSGMSIEISSEGNEDFLLIETPKLSPYIFFKDPVTCMSVSGVPLPLPARSIVQFYTSTESRSTMVRKFTLYDEDPRISYKQAYVPLVYNQLSQYEGLHAGYGYCDSMNAGGRCLKYNRYSYTSFVAPNSNVQNVPPYTLNKKVDITRGLVHACKPNQITAKFETKTNTYSIADADQSDPELNASWDSAHEKGTHFGVNSIKDASVVFENYSNTINTWSDHLGQVVSPDQLRDSVGGRHLCIVDSLVSLSQVISAMESGSYFLTKLSDETLAVIVVVGGKQYCQVVLPGESTPNYMMYHPSAGWVYIDTFTDDFTGDSFRTLLQFGKFLAVSTFVIANIAFGNAAAVYAMEIYATSAYAGLAATAAVDVAFALGEASVVYFVTEDREKFATTLGTGVLFAGVGSAVEYLGIRAIKSWNKFKYGTRIGDAAKGFDAVVKVTVNGKEIKRSIREFDRGLRSKGWSDAQIKILFEEMERSKELTNAVLSAKDLDGAKTWQFLKSNPSLVDNTVSSFRWSEEILNGGNVFAKFINNSDAAIRAIDDSDDFALFFTTAARNPDVHPLAYSGLYRIWSANEGLAEVILSNLTVVQINRIGFNSIVDDEVVLGLTRLNNSMNVMDFNQAIVSIASGNEKNLIEIHEISKMIPTYLNSSTKASVFSNISLLNGIRGKIQKFNVLVDEEIEQIVRQIDSDIVINDRLLTSIKNIYSNGKSTAEISTVINVAKSNLPESNLLYNLSNFIEGLGGMSVLETARLGELFENLENGIKLIESIDVVCYVNRKQRWSLVDIVYLGLPQKARNLND